MLGIGNDGVVGRPPLGTIDRPLGFRGVCGRSDTFRREVTEARGLSVCERAGRPDAGVGPP